LGGYPWSGTWNYYDRNHRVPNNDLQKKVITPFLVKMQDGRKAEELKYSRRKGEFRRLDGED
jgi:hypothetical protein